jgi:circadian clock protein KaiC
VVARLRQRGRRFPAYARTLVGFIRACGATSLITSEIAAVGPLAAPLGGLSFLFHNVVLFRYVEMESEMRNAVNVLKMRDSDHEKGLHRYDINGDGLAVGENSRGSPACSAGARCANTNPNKRRRYASRPRR